MASERKAVADSNAGDASALEKFLLVVVLLGVFAVLMFLLVEFMPGHESGLSLFGLGKIGASSEVRWFVLVAVAGAFGSFVHVANSVGDFIGNDKLKTAWIYWYLLRLPIGSTMALLCYLLFRGGILTGTAQHIQPDASPYGIVGLSALAGMFSKKAAGKLGDVFDTLFRTASDDALGDKMTNGALALDSVEPNPVLQAGQQSVEVRLRGRNFSSTTQVRFAGGILEHKLVGSNLITLVLGAEHLATTRDVAVSLEDSKNGKSSLPFIVQIRAAAVQGAPTVPTGSVPPTPTPTPTADQG